jgi:predicted phage terminase large subunit-like protein
VDFRSLRAGGRDSGTKLEKRWRAELLERHPYKMFWFLQRGYQPHIWQALFHGATHKGKLNMFRHLVAGRRGGKTLSAAWEVLFYAMNPSEFHRDAHGEESTKPLWIWALAKDHKLGNPSLMTFIEVIRQAGLIKGQDYEYNKTEKVFEFFGPGGMPLARVEFKSADDPQNLRGAGLDILWIDESAFIPTREAWDVVFPALADKEGIVITTTTPNGKNWFWAEFWSEQAKADPNNFRVEYTSIDNPWFSKARWLWALEHYHPVMFRQEFLAAFDAMAGVSLNGDWLKFFVDGTPDIQSDDVGIPRYQAENGQWVYDLDLYIGVDPAISLHDEADSFAMALIGVTKDRSQAFLLDYYLDRIPITEQVEKIHEWHLRYRVDFISIESIAYQQALAQMVTRLAGMPPVQAVVSQTKKKNDRLMQLGPVFRRGVVRIRRSHKDFIDQWVSFDYEQKNNRDDLLDAVELALSAAGVLMPIVPIWDQDTNDLRGNSLEQEAWLQILRNRDKKQVFDPELGSQA